MAKAGTVLAIDQGTTSSRAIVFGADLTLLGLAQREFAQHYPASGWVEHAPEDISRTTVETARQALAAAKLGAGDIAAIRITNQRETVVISEPRTRPPIPLPILAEVLDCIALYGQPDHSILGGAIPVLGVAGDQQAATIGQACFSPGMVKATYGTGCFALINTGEKPVASHNRLLTTVAYQLGGQRPHALEGAIFLPRGAGQGV